MNARNVRWHWKWRKMFIEKGVDLIPATDNISFGVLVPASSSIASINSQIWKSNYTRRTTNIRTTIQFSMRGHKLPVVRHSSFNRFFCVWIIRFWCRFRWSDNVMMINTNWWRRCMFDNFCFCFILHMEILWAHFEFLFWNLYVICSSVLIRYFIFHAYFKFILIFVRPNFYLYTFSFDDRLRSFTAFDNYIKRLMIDRSDVQSKSMSVYNRLLIRINIYFLN